ncbi:discoidin domain-containing protein [Kitasatospora sp. NPDC127121]|uniref:discoidin domain-containing protein n=1 Tax=Kitasatospora sp. NPDC127121 TaxID=3345371 RepID=UPI003644EECF
MSDLIVPVRVRTLQVNDKVRAGDLFTRWYPNLGGMVEDNAPAEPGPGQSDQGISEGDDGLHVQWELPEALTRGHYDPATGETTFPLVPNRWLVVRYHRSPLGVRKATGWVVHSDYLEDSDYQARLGYGTSRFATTRSPGGGETDPHTDWIGRHHKLADGPWTEPEDAPRELFLTAVGPGLPAFAAFAIYHKDVFLLHDTLQDIKHEDDPDEVNLYPPDTELSYQVIGWYSDPASDILTKAAEIPGLLPEGVTGVREILAALGWSAPADVPDPQRTLYAGHSLGIPWRQLNFYPQPDARPRPLHQTVAIGHSTADAAAALVTRQTRSPRTGDLVRALFEGTIDTYGTVEGETDLDEATRRAWYSGSDGGHAWQIVPRPSDEPVDLPPVPAWLDELNEAQARYDALAPLLRDAQQRLWTLWWLRNQPGEHPDGFDAAADTQLSPAVGGSLATQAQTLLTQTATLLAALPHGLTPEAQQAAIDAEAHRRGLPETLELKRIAREPFYRPADPVVVIEGTGAGEPLSRDEDDPLPCRIPSGLLTSIVINDATVPVPTTPLVPDLTNLPTACRALLAECDLLDQAYRTTSGTSNALEVALKDPAGKLRGTLAEYTALWQQPWAPMYLQWELHYCPIPYHSDNRDNWTFKTTGKGTDYHWDGTGAQRSGEDSTGDDQMRWLTFADRCYLAPTVSYVLRRQIERYLDSYPESETVGLRALREDYEQLDLLSQTLDGFNDWLLQQDGAARMLPSPENGWRFGDPQSVPAAGVFGTTPPDRFQPVRAGQFYFRDLRIIDRFGRSCDATNLQQQNYLKLPTAHADSVKPDKPLFEGIATPDRFFQLPPRLLQDTRMRFDALRSRDNARYTALSPDPAAVGETPVAGWLLLNYLDETLLVYAPDGAPLGELRVVGDDTRTAFNPLPHAPYAGPADFADVFPDLAGLILELTGRRPPAAFRHLMATIDTTLDTITDPSAQEDRTPARLAGRPVALIRAALGIELQGPPLTSSGWDALKPPPEDYYPSYQWPIKLGDPERLTDGLIGYYASTTGPGGATDYTRLNAVAPAPGTSDYVQPIEYGHDLALPARPGSELITHRLTLLADPHTPVHATTGILPVAALGLDADLVHQALARIRASFRLDPLLAPTRAGEQEAGSPLGAADGYPLANLLDGDLSTYWLSTEQAGAGSWVMVDLGEQRNVDRVDLYPGDLTGGHTTPAGVLEHSADAEAWTVLADCPAAAEIHLDTALSTRYLRLRFTGAMAAPVAVRSFVVSTDAPGSGLVMPRPAAWHGDWTWAEPYATAGPVPEWGELPILQADSAAHPDDPIPTARAGYLQLRPAPGA